MFHSRSWLRFLVKFQFQTKTIVIWPLKKYVRSGPSKANRHLRNSKPRRQHSAPTENENVWKWARLKHCWHWIWHKTVALWWIHFRVLGLPFWLSVGSVFVKFDFDKICDAQAVDGVGEVLVCRPPCQIADIERHPLAGVCGAANSWPRSHRGCRRMCRGGWVVQLVLGEKNDEITFLKPKALVYFLQTQCSRGSSTNTFVIN